MALHSIKISRLVQQFLKNSNGFIAIKFERTLRVESMVWWIGHWTGRWENLRFATNSLCSVEYVTALCLSFPSLGNGDNANYSPEYSILKTINKKQLNINNK